MTEHMMRQPLGLLSVSNNINGNIANQSGLLSPTSCKKRSHDEVHPSKSAQLIAVTPKKATNMAVTNGRRSVKRVKVDMGISQLEDTAATTRQKSQAEVEYRAKMKAWIASYKKEFPTLHFYFDACPEDDVRRCSRKITFLGGVIQGLIVK